MTATVKMDGLGLNHNDAQLIAHNLRQFTRLRTLSLNWNNQVKHGAYFIAELLRHNSSIRSVSMKGNDIQCSGAKHLADALKCSNCAVRELEIEENSIASAGATALAVSLNSNTTVCDLTLRGNPIGDLGARALATVLVSNTSLKVLRVDECGISRAGAITLFGALGRNRQLKLFDLSGNRLSSPVPRAPLLMLASSTLRELILRFAQLDDSDLVQLSVALLECPRLETLSLDGNSLTDRSCDLLRTLLVSCHLCSLNLSANQFGCRTAAVLLRASLDCDRIVRLNFGTNNPCGTPTECGKSSHWKSCGLPALPEHFEADTWAAVTRHCRIMLLMFAGDTASRGKTRLLLQSQLRLSKDLSESETEMLKTSDWWLHVFSKHNCPPELVSAVFQSRLNIPLQK
jgi:Ran GTPase-activating protein (RanGAP) involved in mRNA processing and transport